MKGYIVDGKAMDGNPNPSERLRSIEFFFLLAVGALTPVVSDSHALADVRDTIPSRQGRNLANNSRKRSLGLAIPAVIVKKRENDPHPDTGESGETYDVEAFGQFGWNHLR